jgi:hypothetical protein
MRARILARGLWMVTISLVAGSLVLGSTMPPMG